MQFCFDLAIPSAALDVFRAFRDDMTQLVGLLPQVERIERVRYATDGALVHTSVRWSVRSGVPKALRGVLGGEHFVWTDHATWDEANLSCSWRTESSAQFALDCAGRDQFVPEGQGTRVAITGELRVAPESLPVPRALQGMLAGPLERFLASRMQADLTRTAHALGTLLARRTARTE